MQWSTIALKVAPSASSEINSRDPIQIVGIQNTQNKDALHFDKRTFVVVYNWPTTKNKTDVSARSIRHTETTL